MYADDKLEEEACEPKEPRVGPEYQIDESSLPRVRARVRGVEVQVQEQE